MDETYRYVRGREYTPEVPNNNPWVTTQALQELIKYIEIGSTIVKWFGARGINIFPFLPCQGLFQCLQGKKILFMFFG